MVCYKKREDRHRSRRDIYILKNGFQTHLNDQTIDKKREDRHCSHRDIHILKNGFQTHLHDQCPNENQNLTKDTCAFSEWREKITYQVGI